MSFPNRYAKPCVSCNAPVAVGSGRVVGPPWQTFCLACARDQGIVTESAAFDARVRLFGTGLLAFSLARGLGERFASYRNLLQERGAKYDAGLRQSEVALERGEETISALRAAEFSLEVPPEVKSAIEAHAVRRVAEKAKVDDRLGTVGRHLRDKGLALWDYQRDGVKWLAARDRALLCDEMGLGKTVQALIALPEGAPALVVCPAVAKGVWLGESRRWRPDLRVELLSGRGSFRWPRAGELVVTNYDVLPKPEEVEHVPEPQTVLLADEAHYLKNHKSKRTKRFRELGESVREAGGKTWLFTGTPLLGKPPDLWALCQAAGLARDAFGSFKEFLDLFSARPGKFGGYEWGRPDPSVPDRFRRIALRRLRAQVLPNLPTKTYQDHEVELEKELSREVDDSLPEDWEAAVEAAIDQSAGVPFEKMSEARRLLAAAKSAALLELVESFEAQDEPLLVFSCHSTPLEPFYEREGWAVIEGDTKPSERTMLAEAFQEGKLLGLAGNVKAMGTALTLTRAAHVAFVDQSWTPAENLQAEDRVVRVGQTRGVVIHRLVAEHALDRRVAQLLDRKTRLIRQALEGAA